jgi:hypothetical protein
MSERTDRLREAAAELAIASLTADGELAWALTDCAAALGTVVQTTNETGALRNRQPEPAELADAFERLLGVRSFLETARSRY